MSWESSRPVGNLSATAWEKHKGCGDESDDSGSLQSAGRAHASHISSFHISHGGIEEEQVHETQLSDDEDHISPEERQRRDRHSAEIEHLTMFWEHKDFLGEIA